MPKSRLYIFYAVVLVGLGVYLWMRYRTIPDKPLTEIVVVGENGAPEALQISDNKPLVINYFAHWCGPCMMEIPALAKFQSEHSDQVQLIGLTDDSQDKIIEVIQNRGINYEVRKVIGSMADHGVRSIPATVIFDEKGDRVEEHIGVLNFEQLKDLIEESTSVEF